MKSRKNRRINSGASGQPPPKPADPKPAREAPNFLVRLVGKTRANDLCRDDTIQHRPD